MIRGKHSLDKGGLGIGYTKPIKMSKTIFVRNKLDFSDTSFVDDILAISKNNRSL